MSQSQATVLDYQDAEVPTEFDFNDFVVKQLPKATAERFISEHHYSRGCGNAIMAWGVYDDATSQLIGAIAFQTPISENTRCSVFEKRPYDDGDRVHPQNVCECDHIGQRHGYREHVTELHRMAIVDAAPQNTATWFISRALDCLKAHKPKYWAVISMADATEGHDGTVYQAANADYYGMTAPRKCYLDSDGRLRTRRQCGENITLSDARDRGWEVVEREQKYRYVFWTPDPYQSKDDLRELAEIDLQEYPSND